jgi:hypothetical protein
MTFAVVGLPLLLNRGRSGDSPTPPRAVSSPPPAAASLNAGTVESGSPVRDSAP